ncbi:hypothetical protein Tco_1105432 [Tanacetum coccineum]
MKIKRTLFGGLIPHDPWVWQGREVEDDGDRMMVLGGCSGDDVDECRRLSGCIAERSPLGTGEKKMGEYKCVGGVVVVRGGDDGGESVVRMMLIILEMVLGGCSGDDVDECRRLRRVDRRSGAGTGREEDGRV